MYLTSLLNIITGWTGPVVCLLHRIFTCVGSVTLDWFDLHDQHKARLARHFTADLSRAQPWLTRRVENEPIQSGAKHQSSALVSEDGPHDLLRPSSREDPLIISSSQERLHYTGNCFYFIWTHRPHLFLTELTTDVTRDVRAESRNQKMIAGVRVWVMCVTTSSSRVMWPQAWSAHQAEGVSAVSAQMARVITLCPTLDTFYQWLVTGQSWGECGWAMWELKGLKNTSNTQQKPNHTDG